jgi:hypothetical protein
MWGALANTMMKRKRTSQSDLVDVLAAGLRSVGSDSTDPHILMIYQRGISDRGVSSPLAECIRHGQQSFPLVR